MTSTVITGRRTKSSAMFTTPARSWPTFTLVPGASRNCPTVTT